jgi:hypothetical protein
VGRARSRASAVARPANIRVSQRRCRPRSAQLIESTLRGPLKDNDDELKHRDRGREGYVLWATLGHALAR